MGNKNEDKERTRNNENFSFFVCRVFALRALAEVLGVEVVVKVGIRRVVEREETLGLEGMRSLAQILLLNQRVFSPHSPYCHCYCCCYCFCYRRGCYCHCHVVMLHLFPSANSSIT